MFISCSASSVESDEDNKIADRPITPKEMQRMMGRGFDVQWAEFSKKIELYGEDEVKAIRQKGFNTARIRMWATAGKCGCLTSWAMVLPATITQKRAPIRSCLFLLSTTR